MAACSPKARAFLSRLTRNTNAFYANRLSYEEFGRRNRAAWDAIEAAGGRVKACVLDAIRKRLPAGGPKRKARSRRRRRR